MIYKQECYDIIGAAIAVHHELGNGFVEYVYQDALALEFAERSIPYEREKTIQISYKGHVLSHNYIADFVCYNAIVVELKAVSALLPEHEAQILNYLKATGLHVGLLINFGEKSLNYRRFVLD